MTRAHQLVGFILDSQNYAVPLAQVTRVVHAVAVTPLPNAPEIILGIINFSGRVIPVVDIRRRFRLPGRKTALYDHLIIARTAKRDLAFLAEAVTGVRECREEDITAAAKIIPGLEYLEGVLKFQDGLIFIHDLERFLSLDEAQSLEAALQGFRPAP